MSQVDEDVRKAIEALKRLIEHAKRDTGQSRRVADFLLAWWNPTNCGRFDMLDTWALDGEIADDVVLVFGLIVRCGKYPDTLGFDPQFKALVKAWRPELVE